MGTIKALDTAIKAVCPIHGVNSDKAIAFKLEATVGERAAAQAIADTWNFDAPTAEEVAAEAEREAVKQLQSATKADAMFKALEKANAAQIANWIDTNFSGMTAQQRGLLKLLTQVAAMVLRERA